MIEPDILSPDRSKSKEVRSFPIKQANSSSVFPTLQISKFQAKKNVETPFPETEEKVNKNSAQTSQLMEPTRRNSETLDFKAIEANFKTFFRSLPTTDQDKVIVALKNVMMRSHTVKEIELNASIVKNRFSPSN